MSVAPAKRPPPSMMTSLPAVLLQNALTYLSPPEFAKILCVSKDVRASKERVFDQWLRETTKTSNVVAFATYEKFSRLSLRKSTSEPDLLTRMKNLTHVQIAGWHTHTNSNLLFCSYLTEGSVNRLRSLEIVDFPDIPVSTLDLIATHCTELRELTIRGNVRPVEAWQGAGMTQLRKLVLSGSNGSAFIRSCAKVPNLRELELRSSLRDFGHGITQNGLSFILEQAPHLQHLGVRGPRHFQLRREDFPIQAVIHLGQNLTSLDLSEGEDDLEDLLAVIEKCTKLAHFDLTGARVCKNPAQIVQVKQACGTRIQLKGLE